MTVVDNEDPNAGAGRPPVNSLMLRLRPLVDDRFRKAADTKKGGNAAHRLGVAKANISAGTEAIIRILRRNPARGIVEINQYIPTKDDIEVAVSRHVLWVDQICAREMHGFSKSRINANPPLVDMFEIPANELARQPHQGAGAVIAFRGGV